MRNAEHYFLGYSLDGSGEVHFALGNLGFRRSGRSAQESMELGRCHGQALAVVEVAHVHAKGAVLLQIDQVLQNQIAIHRLAVRCQAHQFVFTTVDSKPGVVGECGVEEPE